MQPRLTTRHRPRPPAQVAFAPPLPRLVPAPRPCTASLPPILRHAPASAQGPAHWIRPHPFCISLIDPVFVHPAHPQTPPLTTCPAPTWSRAHPLRVSVSQDGVDRPLLERAAAAERWRSPAAVVVPVAAASARARAPSARAGETGPARWACSGSAAAITCGESWRCSGPGERPRRLHEALGV